MQSSMVMFTSSVFDREYPFWANLVQKIKILSLSWNLIPTLTRICRIQWWCFVFFSTRSTFLSNFCPKNQNCQLKLKFAIQNSMMMFSFSVLDRKYRFWVNFVQGVKIVKLSWNSVQSLVRVCRIRGWFFFVKTESTLFREILSKISKLSVSAEI